MATTIETQLQKTPIAVIGMSSLFPNATNLESYWDNIINKASAIMDVPADRWEIKDVYDSDKNAPDKSYCKRGGFIPEIDFNPIEFGLPPNILEVTDTSQLLSLIVARDLIKDTGYKGNEFDRENTGVILGVGGGQKLIMPLVARLQGPVWEKVLRSSGVAEADIQTLIAKMKKAYIPWVENSFPGMLGNVIAGRVANRFDLGGINCVVDAACAGSLAAMKMAVSELLENRANLMITGGVETDNSPFMYLNFSKTPAFTTDEEAKPFDADSKGIVIGEGIGMVMLKRLADAERDGDRIYSVIKGIGTSSDGRFKSIYAPRDTGQKLCIDRAYQDAGYNKTTVNLIEAHGTGTKAGDAAEFSGLNLAFGEQGERQDIALGSVKSQIGHTKSAAGVAGFIKASAALHQKILPPTNNVTQPNPKLDIENTAFYINSESRPWIKGENPRRAGVSAFGFGGSNFHFALEEYQTDHQEAYRLQARPRLFVLFNENVDGLKQDINQWLKSLEADPTGQKYFEFVEKYKNPELTQENARLGFIALDQNEVISKLKLALKTFAKQAKADNWSLLKGLHFRRYGLADNAKIVALFSGQGSQYLNMCDDVAKNFPPMRETFSAFDHLMQQSQRTPLSKVVYPIPAFNPEKKKQQDQLLTQTENIQPAIGAVSVGLFKIASELGFKADMIAGHSFGELTALWAAGVMDDKTFYQLAKARGEAMAAPAEENFDAGSMCAVIGDAEVIESKVKALSGVEIANYNSPEQVVLAGATQAIADAVVALSKAGFKAVQLPVAAAFHSPLVKHAHEPFAKAIEAAKFNKPSTDVYSNVTAKLYANNAKQIKESFKGNVLQSVRFTEQIRNMAEQGAKIFVEFGPKNVLTRLIGSILKDHGHLAVAMNASPKKDSDVSFRDALIQLKVAGVNISIEDIYQKPVVKPTGQKAAMAIKLNGANYVSPATRKAYEEALTDGFRLTGGESTVVEKIIEVEKIVEVEKIIEVPVASQVSNTPVNTTQQMDWATLQTSSMQAHEQYLQNQQDYSQNFFQLMQQQMDMAANNQPIPESFSQGVEQFHQYQQETLQIHDRYLQGQVAFSQSAYQLISGQQIQAPAPQPVIAPTVTQQAPVVETVVIKKAKPAPIEKVVEVIEPIVTSTGLDLATITKGMLEIVNEKTGYPEEMLELGMDMEADLGIDSIKRVEILGEMTNKFPQLPELDQNALAEMRTLGEIVEYVEQQAPKGEIAAPAGNGLDLATITKGMLEIVNEKTGYPEEMLELGMDMEADLGIDSIKRVEILGEMTNKFPQLPELDQNALSEMRTLGEIVDYVEQQAPKGEIAPSTGGGGLDLATITQGMLEIVNEKTGYPEEMLELGMDMEADLGIDSIKRVEILGAMTDKFPQLPELDQNALSEMRTLGEIVDYVEQQAPKSEAPAPTGNGLDLATITKGMLEIVNEKTGYPEEMLELGMDMEADLGIDSIKRVEILGAMTDKFPQLPELDQNALAEMHTLAEIINYVESQAPTTETPTVTPVTSNSNLDLATITKGMLEIVNDKTGYPEEMLELDMDMEADLGIDSIKRVEILGAMTDKFPEMPELDQNALSEMRTLGEIINYVEKKTLKIELAPVVTQKIPKTSCSLVVKKILARPDILASEIKIKGKHCVINDNGTELPASLAAALEKIGWKVTILSLQPTDSALADAFTGIGDIHGFIYLSAKPITGNQVIQFSDQDKAALKTAFFSAKQLDSQLTKQAEGRNFFVTVSYMDGEIGTAQTGTYDAIQGGLNGLTKTVNLEWQKVFCRAIDLASNYSISQASELIMSELFDPDISVVEVGHSAKGRMTLAAEPRYTALPEVSNQNINKETVFFVSGGGKGVTAACVIQLAQSYQCKFILAGRTAYNGAEPAWAKGITNDGDLKRLSMQALKDEDIKPTPKLMNDKVWAIKSDREITKTLDAIKAAGGQAEYISADVTKLADLQENSKAAIAKLGQINGLIHGAGVLADKPIGKKTEQDFERVFNTKIGGLETILQLISIEQLAYFVNFSSAAGFYGNNGQADYSVANEILNKTSYLVHQLAPNCHPIAFDWGPWDGGMVTAELKRYFQARNVEIIPIKEGAEILQGEMHPSRRDTMQLLVGSSMRADSDGYSNELRQFNITSPLLLADNPFLQDHVIGGNPVLPSAMALSWMANICEHLQPNYQFLQCENFQVLNGIKFNGEEAKEYQIDVKEINKEVKGEVKFEVMISSNNGKKQAWHYRAEILVTQNSLETPTIYNKTNLQQQDLEISLYQGHTLFHGIIFQGIKKVLNNSPEKMTLLANLAPIKRSDQGQFPISVANPFATDLMFQAMLVWVRENRELGSLPLKFWKMEHYANIPENTDFYISVDIDSTTATSLKADIILHDENGNIYSQAYGAEVTMSKSLDVLFAQQ